MADRYAIATIIQDNEGKVLLAQRGPAAKSQQGRWENMGGGVGEGEDPKAAAVREAREELGVEVSVEEELLNYVPPADEHGTVWHTIVYRAVVINGTPSIQELDKCSALQWFAKSELRDVALTNYTAEDFRRLGWLV